MHVATVFHVSIYGLVSLSAVMLGWAEGVPFPQGLTLPLAAMAYEFNERRGRARLPPVWSNGLGLLAVLWAGLELLIGGVEARLLSGAHLSITLCWLVFFQSPGPRKYWLMCALSVMHVALGAVLTERGGYGVFLAGYLVLAIWTLSVFSLYRAGEEFRHAESAAAWWAPGRPRVPVVAVASASAAGTGAGEAGGGGPFRRRSEVRGVIQHDPNERWIGLRFALGTLSMSGLTLVVAMAFFLLVPRLWLGGSLTVEAETDTLPSALTGFSEDVQLGEMGQILQSTEPVLQLQLFDAESEEELDVREYATRLGHDEPLFRGQVLDSYENGTWSTQALTLSLPLNERPHTRARLVRQEIQLEPIGTRVLFAIHPLEAIWLEGQGHTVRVSRPSSVIRTEEERSSDHALRYSVYSRAAPQPGTEPVAVKPVLGSRFERFRRYYTGLPDGLERLKRLARRIAGADSADPPPPLQMARKLRSYLRESGEFTYTLNRSVENAQIDPVEDFLFNRKAGHCEYFASALALMLRAVDIPSRMISGFKGGTVNKLTGRYEVQQRHAHSWVEAYVGDRWIVLDPTPATARAASVESLEPWTFSWQNMKGVLSDLWYRRIVNLDLGQQQNQFYGPLQGMLNSLWREMRDRGIRFSSWARLFREVGSSPGRWFSWQGGLITFALLLALCGTVWALRRSLVLARRLWQGVRRRDRNVAPRIDFYERFRKLCASRRLVRGPSQTQREFAEQVRRSFQQSLDSSELRDVPANLTEHFYQIRFGNVPLIEEQAREIDRQLTRLERALCGTGNGERVSPVRRGNRPTE